MTTKGSGVVAPAWDFLSAGTSCAAFRQVTLGDRPGGGALFRVELPLPRR